MSRRHAVRLILAVVLILAGTALLGSGTYQIAGTAGLLVQSGLTLILIGCLLPW